MRLIVRISFVLLWLIATGCGFAAVVSIKDSGEVVGDVLLVSDTVVALRTGMGSMAVPLEKINFVLFDEAGRRFVGSVEGIVLKSGIVIYGERFQITETSGTVEAPFGIVQLNLSDVLLFTPTSLAKYESSFPKRRSPFPAISIATDGRLSFKIGSLVLFPKDENVETGDPTYFKIVDGSVVYLVRTEFVERISIPQTLASRYRYLVTLNSGFKLICNVRLNPSGVIISAPFLPPTVISISEVLAVEVFDATRTATPGDYGTSKNVAALGEFTVDEASFDERTGTIIVKIVADELLLLGRRFTREFEIPVEKVSK